MDESVTNPWLARVPWRAAQAAPVRVAPATRGVFAVPAIPKATPFPGPQASSKQSKDSTAPGRLLPKYELNAGYSYMNFDPGSPFGSFNNHGATGGFTYNVGRVLGLTSELGQYHFNRDVGGSP